MNFKEWLLNENPDTVVLKNSPSLSLDKKTLTWRDGQTFCIFDTYSLISLKGVAVIHESIAHRINECKLAIEALLRKEITPKELNDCLTSPSSTVNFLESKGQISKKTIDQMLKTIEMSRTIQKNKDNLKNTSAKPVFVSYRVMSLKETPEVILGRIWTDEKIISFWNPSNRVFSQSGNVLDFIKELGNPAEYKYEVQNELLSYEDFVQNKIKSNNFDASIVHTMEPGDVKNQLQRMMGMVPSKSIDIRNKQLAYTSENTKQHANSINK